MCLQLPFISCLPIEVLSEIFATTLEFSTLTQRERKQFNALRHVCRHWRTIVNSTDLLWQHQIIGIDLYVPSRSGNRANSQAENDSDSSSVTDSDLDQALMHLEEPSGHYLIPVQLSIHATSYSPEFNERTIRANVQGIAFRIKALSIDIDIPQLANLNAILPPLPALTHISLISGFSPRTGSINPYIDYQWTPISFALLSPGIISLELEDCYPIGILRSIDTFCHWGGLTTLKVRESAIPLSILHRILALSVNLREADLDFDYIATTTTERKEEDVASTHTFSPGSNPQDRGIRLAKLEIFVISTKGENWKSFIKPLHTPSLVDWSITSDNPSKSNNEDSENGSSSAVGNDIMKQLVSNEPFPNLTFLEISTSILNTSSLVEALQQIPKLRRLVIEFEEEEIASYRPAYLIKVLAGMVPDQITFLPALSGLSYTYRGGLTILEGIFLCLMEHRMPMDLLDERTRFGVAAMNSLSIFTHSGALRLTPSAQAEISARMAMGYQIHIATLQF